MRIFVTKCIVGSFLTKGEGNSKKVRINCLVKQSLARSCLSLKSIVIFYGLPTIYRLFS